MKDIKSLELWGGEAPVFNTVVGVVAEGFELGTYDPVWIYANNSEDWVLTTYGAVKDRSDLTIVLAVPGQGKPPKYWMFA